MGKGQEHETSSGLVSEKTKENLKKWGVRFGLVAIGLMALVWIL